jgi:hypothetical protein
MLLSSHWLRLPNTRYGQFCIGLQNYQPFDAKRYTFVAIRKVGVKIDTLVIIERYLA